MLFFHKGGTAIQVVSQIPQSDFYLRSGNYDCPYYEILGSLVSVIADTWRAENPEVQNQ